MSLALPSSEEGLGWGLTGSWWWWPFATVVCVLPQSPQEALAVWCSAHYCAKDDPPQLEEIFHSTLKCDSPINKFAKYKAFTEELLLSQGSST